MEKKIRIQSLVALIIVNAIIMLPLWISLSLAQYAKPALPLAEDSKIQIGKLWIGTDAYPYVTNYGFLGYMDYPGGSEDYYVTLFSLILSGNAATQDSIILDLGANTASGSGAPTFYLWQHDTLHENWDTVESKGSYVFWEATASFGGNPWDVNLNTKIRAWGIEDYDDFVMVQYKFTNTGTSDITDFWLASSMPAECGEKTVENRNLDDIVAFDTATGLTYMRDDDGDGGLSPYWVGQALLKAPPAGSSSDAIETERQIWTSLHYFRWDNIPNSRLTLYNRIRERVYGNVQTSPGVWDLFSGVGPYTLKAGGDIEFTICYVYGKGGEIFGNLTNAKSLLANDFIVPEERIPPFPPSLSGVVRGSEITVTWMGDEAEKEGDFAGYRLYKSDLSFVGPWRLIFEDPKPCVREYVDRAQVGYKNFYGITAYDTLGNESSLWAACSKTLKGLEASTYPEKELGKIVVVPNPYIGNATWELQDYENKILFSHLPAKCKIYIYTLSGDLIDIVYHNVEGDPTPDVNPTGDESWDLVTQNNQSMASGLYLFRVVSESGDTKMGKFAVIKGEK